jgi:hypothetical protein
MRLVGERIGGAGPLLMSVVLSGAALAQEASKPPTFPAEAALVVVDVSVVDARGRPVRDLNPEDFSLEVNGRSRRIVSAGFVPLGEEGVTAPTGGAAPAAYSTNEGAVRGRLVVIAIDQGSARPGPMPRSPRRRTAFSTT